MLGDCRGEPFLKITELNRTAPGIDYGNSLKFCLAVVAARPYFVILTMSPLRAGTMPVSKRADDVMGRPD